ncbi:TVP38/TMEM64 family protein [Pontibacter sp. H259]|uniref:TVP38/TMEM64 family protein n=1 Tax=Pontibacter sp. H259 TaxID=3133421 RepID=UPI0030C1C251
MTEIQKDKQHPATAEKQKRNYWPLIISSTFIGGVILSYFIFPEFKQNLNEGWTVLTSGDEQRISEWVSQFGFWGPFFIVLAMVAQMFLVVINVVLLMLVAIIAYGPVWGSVIAITAVLTASTIGYIIGKSVGEAGVSKLIGKKSERKISGFMEEYGVWAVIIARLSPFLSDDAISFVAGFATMRYWQFMLSTLAGILPLTILLAWLGKDWERLKTGLIWVSIGSIILFIGYVIFNKYYRKNKPS